MDADEHRLFSGQHDAGVSHDAPFRRANDRVQIDQLRRRHEEFRKTDQDTGQFVAIDEHAASVSGKQAAA